MVLWQHVVLCKGTLLRLRRTVGVRSVLRMSDSREDPILPFQHVKAHQCLVTAPAEHQLRTPTARCTLYDVPLHNTINATFVSIQLA